jgi:hypothetical protein
MRNNKGCEGCGGRARGREKTREGKLKGERRRESSRARGDDIV